MSQEHIKFNIAKQQLIDEMHNRGYYLVAENFTEYINAINLLIEDQEIDPDPFLIALIETAAEAALKITINKPII